MKKNNLYSRFLAYLNNKDTQNITNSSLEDAGDNNELEELISLHKEIQQMVVPEPSDAMKTTFEDRLKTMAGKKENTKHGLTAVFKESFFLKVAASIILFVSGFLAGNIINKQSNQTETIIAELHNTQKALMLTLLEQPAATDRLKAVNISYSISDNDQKIIDALFITLNNDPNINVRLTAIDALIAKADYPQVRLKLIQAINKQESPIIQSALADAMVFLNETRSIEEFQKLLDSHKLDDIVEKKLETSIQLLTKI